MISDDLFEALRKAIREDRALAAAVTPQTRDELHDYILQEYGIDIPRVAVCHDRKHCSPFDALADAYFATEREMVWVGPRTGGKTLGAAILEHVLMTHFADTVVHAGAVEKQAMRCYEYLRKFFAMPQFEGTLDGESLMSRTKLMNGAYVEAIPMTSNQLNSPHTRVLFCLTGRALISTINGQRRLDEIVCGDLIWSYDRIARVRRLNCVRSVFNNGVKRIVRARFSDGSTLEATPEHCILTHTGWRRIEQIEPGTRIVSDVRDTNMRNGFAVLQKAYVGREAGQPLPMRVRRSQTQSGSGLLDVFAPRADEAKAGARHGLLRNVRYNANGQKGMVPRACAVVSEYCMRMRSEEIIRRASLREVLSNRSRPSHENDERKIVAEASDDASSQEFFCIASRKASRRIARQARYRLRPSSFDRAIFRGLFAFADAHSYRGAWRHSQSIRHEAARRRARDTHRSAGVPYRSVARGRNALMDAHIDSSVWLVSVEDAGIEQVYDLEVDRDHNYFANGIVVHNCDEIELTSEKLLDEAKSIPMRVNGRAPLTIYTSSRKKAFGPMENLLETSVEAKRPVHTWCAFEIIKTCPPERHKDGAKAGCGSCELESQCRNKTTDKNGNVVYEPGPGKAARADGWMEIDDVIGKYLSLSSNVWDSQWMSNRPDTSGLAYPDFDENVHMINYEYNPAFPVVAGLDFGYVNPSVAIYAQPTPSDDIVIFAEDYASMRRPEEFAADIRNAPWFQNIQWIVADSADRGARETLIAHRVPNEPADKSPVGDTSSITAGINLCRWLLKPPGRRPMLYFSRSCTMTKKEIKRYHHPEEKDDKNTSEVPVKSHDHAMDAMRYMMMRLFRGQLVVG